MSGRAVTGKYLTTAKLKLIVPQLQHISNSKRFSLFLYHVGFSVRIQSTSYMLSLVIGVINSLVRQRQAVQSPFRVN